MDDNGSVRWPSSNINVVKQMLLKIMCCDGYEFKEK